MSITGLVFLVLWELYAVNKPRHSSYVTATELDHIRGKRLKKAMLNNVNTRTPFKKILLSPCTIAICACCYTQSFIVSCITAYLPTFNHAIMNIDILWNGFASSLPFFVHATSSTVFLYGFLTLRKHGISKTTIIKGYSIVATSGVSLCILAFFILTSDQFLVLALLQSAALGFLSAFLVGCIASVTAIVPQFTSFALPYTEVYTHLAAVLAPVAVEMFSKTNEFKQWSILLCLLLVLLTGIVFSLFAHGCHEIVLQPYSEHLTIQSRIRSHRELHEQEALQPIQHSKSSMEPPAVTYCGGEASIPLRYEELPLGSHSTSSSAKSITSLEQAKNETMVSPLMIDITSPVI
ncbi:hypothetical protein RB195_005463 [Necator americanus]|uniref:Major facilitator superfamily (MFS) profile domain-containing protein n=1 Tax=Necator americanus TaxID=51031 RepID=A0ABR1BPU8_NECAM